MFLRIQLLIQTPIINVRLFETFKHDGSQLCLQLNKSRNLYPVELVEAGPRAARSQPLEELPHGLVVEAVGAVEDDALLGQRLRQILGRLSLSGTRGSFGRSAQVQLQRSHQRSEVLM